eukprot:GHVR01166557.1.p1 GENE.GHVR01166557.1~~GHVR01166557.1.p1  ORF type:complete len:264 (+),score=61.40 GHVR01166557.1:55-846(+)
MIYLVTLVELVVLSVQLNIGNIANTLNVGDTIAGTANTFAKLTNTRKPVLEHLIDDFDYDESEAILQEDDILIVQNDYHIGQVFVQDPSIYRRIKVDQYKDPEDELTGVMSESILGSYEKYTDLAYAEDLKNQETSLEGVIDEKVTIPLVKGWDLHVTRQIEYAYELERSDEDGEDRIKEMFEDYKGYTIECGQDAQHLLQTIGVNIPNNNNNNIRRRLDVIDPIKGVIDSLLMGKVPLVVSAVKRATCLLVPDNNYNPTLPP